MPFLGINVSSDPIPIFSPQVSISDSMIRCTKVGTLIRFWMFIFFNLFYLKHYKKNFRNVTIVFHSPPDLTNTWNCDHAIFSFFLNKKKWIKYYQRCTEMHENRYTMIRFKQKRYIFLYESTVENHVLICDWHWDLQVHGEYKSLTSWLWMQILTAFLRLKWRSLTLENLKHFCPSD